MTSDDIMSVQLTITRPFCTIYSMIWPVRVLYSIKIAYTYSKLSTQTEASINSYLRRLLLRIEIKEKHPLWTSTVNHDESLY